MAICLVLCKVFNALPRKFSILNEFSTVQLIEPYLDHNGSLKSNPGDNNDILCVFYRNLLPGNGYPRDVLNRLADIPCTIAWPLFPGLEDNLCMSARDIVGVHITDICQGYLHSVCYNVWCVRSTRCVTDATGRPPVHASRTDISCAHICTHAHEWKCSILLILLGLLPHASGPLN